MIHFACAHPSVAGGHDAHKALIALSSPLDWTILKVDNFTNYPPFTGQFQALGRVNVREGRSGEAMGGGKERVKGRE